MSGNCYKHCMIGDFGVGKTCIVKKYMNPNFDYTSTESTIAANYETKECVVGKKKVSLHIWVCSITGSMVDK